MTTRRWWASQWEEGKQYVAGLIAQDVQDALLEEAGRWPLCRACDELDPHALYIHPELGGPDPDLGLRELRHRRRPAGRAAAAEPPPPIEPAPADPAGSRAARRDQRDAAACGP